MKGGITGCLTATPDKMKDYKRLTHRDEKKLNFYKKLGKATKKSFKWWGAFCGIICLFVVAIFSLYHFMDNDKSSGVTNCVQKSLSNNSGLDEETFGLNELSKKELERESAKLERESVEKESADAILTKKESADDVSTKKEIEKSEDKKTSDFSVWNSSCPLEMIVINKDNFIPDSFKPCVKMCRGKEVGSVMAENLESMIAEAKSQGIMIWISSGYRDINLQTKLFNRQIEREKSKAVISNEEAEKRAAKVVAKPRTSEHNTGLAIDFNGVEENFYTTKEYKWLTDNAHKYGFIERYQKKWKDDTGVVYEPWHFRYVGNEYASKIKESGVCLEKYILENLMKKIIEHKDGNQHEG